MIYEIYKEIESSWLKEVPSHWDVRRIASVFEQRKERNKPIKTDEILSLSAKYGVSLYSERKEKGGNKPKEDISNYNICHEGDILVNCMNIVAGSVGMSQYYGAISPVYYALKIIDDNSDKRYMEYVFRNYNFQRSLVGTGKGIQMSESDDGRLFTVRMRIAYDSLKVQNIPIPPLKEQEKIANFLNWKTNEIDKTIEIELKKINAAKNLKKSILQEVIMKEKPGENYKNSGLLWIEKIPITWEVKKVKQLLEKKVKVATYEDETVICSNHGYSFLRGEQKIGLSSDDINMYQKVSKGQIMVHGMDTWHGAICISSHDGKCTKVVHVCESKENYEYIVYYLRLLAFIGMYKPYSDGVRQNTSDFRSWSKLGTIDVLLPSRKEQDEIVRKIKEVEEVCDNIIISAKKIIEENTLLKQSIISEVVTGQIDIRDIVIPEYEKVESVFEEDEDQVEGGEDEWD